MRFKIEPFELTNVRKEFKFTLQQMKLSIKPDLKDEDAIFNFDFVRNIFLERGLWYFSLIY